MKTRDLKSLKSIEAEEKIKEKVRTSRTKNRKNDRKETDRVDQNLNKEVKTKAKERSKSAKDQNCANCIVSRYYTKVHSKEYQINPCSSEPCSSPSRQGLGDN